MNISVIGAGAIGNLVAGYLKLNNQEVSLVGHSASVKAIEAEGLQISGVRGDFNIKIAVAQRLNYRPELVILATKTQDLTAALEGNLKFLSGATILTTQNGVQADDIVAKYLPRKNIISSIVMFGATCLEPAKIVHNFEGRWVIGSVVGQNDTRVTAVSEILNQAFPVMVAEDIKGMKYFKIFVNANNCISAILGVSMQEAFSDLDTSSISIAIWKEGLKVVQKAGVNLLSLPDFPLERLTKLTSAPLPDAAKIFSGIMANLSKEPLYGSILQSIKKGKPSEIDYINGEFVNLAQKYGSSAPLNAKLVDMVHQVEKTNRFFSKEQLVLETKDCIH